jgi:ATP-dependent RNA helicase RhlB
VGKNVLAGKSAATGKDSRQDSTGRRKPAAGTRKTEDLSQLSFDERMALYKQKYDSKQDAGSPARVPVQAAEKKGKPAAKSVEKKRAQAKTGTTAAKGKSAGKKSEKKPVAAKEGTDHGGAGEKAANAKKGFFSRLMGIFGKKE